jgi:hypothetical protein
MTMRQAGRSWRSGSKQIWMKVSSQVQVSSNWLDRIRSLGGVRREKRKKRFWPGCKAFCRRTRAHGTAGPHRKAPNWLRHAEATMAKPKRITDTITIVAAR